MDAAPKAYYEEAVFPEVWDLPTPPVKIRIPEGFDPTNPAHVEAAQQTYQKAYDMGELGKAAQKYIGDIEAKNVEYAANNTAVAEYSQRIKRLEDEMKRGTKPETSGIRRFFNTEGNPDVPLTAKDYSAKMIALDAAKKGLASAEQKLKQASETPSPTVYEVQLPQEAPAQESQAPQQTQVKPAIEEAQQQAVSPQMQRYEAIKRDYLKQAQQLLSTPGVKRADVDAAYKNAIAQLDSEWQPEEREINGVLYSYTAPNKREVVRDNVNIVKQEFNDITQRIRKNIENIDQIEALRKAAEEASTAKGQDRAARIEALKASLKSINTAISGTSDALSQNEYLRLGGSLQAWNFITAMQPDSMANFFTTNPGGFAKSVEVLRNMTGNRMVSAFKQADKIAGKYPVLKDLVPEKPSYYSQITKGYDQGQVIERGQPAAQQGTQVISKGGSPYIIKKAK